MIDDSDFIFAQSLRGKKCFCWCHTNTLGTILRRFPLQIEELASWGISDRFRMTLCTLLSTSVRDDFPLSKIALNCFVIAAISLADLQNNIYYQWNENHLQINMKISRWTTGITFPKYSIYSSRLLLPLKVGPVFPSDRPKSFRKYTLVSIK